MKTLDLTDAEIRLLKHCVVYRDLVGGWSQHDAQTGRISAYQSVLGKLCAAESHITEVAANPA